MKRIKVRVFATIREAVGVDELDLDIDEGFEDLVKKADEVTDGRFSKAVWSEGWFRENLIVFVNGRNVEFLGGKNAKLRDGDVVAIFPAIAGGLCISLARPFDL